MSSAAVTQSVTIDRKTSDVFLSEQMWPIRWQLYLMFIALAGWMGLGQAIYDGQCAACHTTDGAASIGPTWQGLIGSEVSLDDGGTVTADEA